MSRHPTQPAFPGNVTTDEILPGEYLDRRNDEVGQFAMAGLDPKFVGNVKPGDILVAGPNFGSGSGRETAPMALQQAGIAALIAPSFGRIFFRNSINIGLPAVNIRSTEHIEEGDLLIVDLDAGTVVDERTGETYPIQNLRGTSREILKAGGIIAYTKLRQAGKTAPSAENK